MYSKVAFKGNLSREEHKRLATPFESQEQAIASTEGFAHDLLALAAKYRIRNVCFMTEIAAIDTDGKEIPLSNYGYQGSRSVCEMLLAFTYGQLKGKRVAEDFVEGYKDARE